MRSSAQAIGNTKCSYCRKIRFPAVQALYFRCSTIFLVAATLFDLIIGTPECRLWISGDDGNVIRNRRDLQWLICAIEVMIGGISSRRAKQAFAAHIVMPWRPTYCSEYQSRNGLNLPSFFMCR